MLDSLFIIHDGGVPVKAFCLTNPADLSAKGAHLLFCARLRLPGNAAQKALPEGRRTQRAIPAARPEQPCISVRAAMLERIAM